MNPPALEGGFDAEALYRRYERPLRAWLSRRVTATPTLVEDACASAWLIVLAKRPRAASGSSGWLRTTALREAYRLLRQERRQPAIDQLDERRAAFVPALRDDPETALEAKRRLLALAALSERQRRYAGTSGRHQLRRGGAGGTGGTNRHSLLRRPISETADGWHRAFERDELPLTGELHRASVAATSWVSLPTL